MVVTWWIVAFLPSVWITYSLLANSTVNHFLSRFLPLNTTHSLFVDFFSFCPELRFQKHTEQPSIQSLFRLTTGMNFGTFSDLTDC